MTGLNKKQYQASLPRGGFELVIAGAGTGKTKTLVKKIENILNNSSCLSENILILTFSRKAALEIKKRVKEELGAQARNLSAGTFHSFSLAFLKEKQIYLNQRFGFSNFPAVLKEEQKEIILDKFIRARLADFNGLPKGVVVSLMEKINSLDKKTFHNLKKFSLDKRIKEVKDFFSSEKKRLNLIDYGDMIDFTITILREKRKFREEMNKRYQYILVDEFQDTSQKNFELLKLLLPDRGGNLFVVGDDWQSIYGFRKARVEYIIKMKKYFPELKIHNLDINYRSKTEIVKLSNKFISHNKFRTKKKLKSFQGQGGEIKFHKVISLAEEIFCINKIVSEVKEDLKIVVLYRNNRQGESLQEQLPSYPHLKDRLEFMTMHASKGLEFDLVIVAGISDKIIPDRSSSLEEERRLFYVALSRAKTYLHLLYYPNLEGEFPRFIEELQ